MTKRADMVENLIPRRQLRSKRAQYRRKLAIYTKNTLFLMSPAKRGLKKKNVANWWPNRADMVENLILDANAGADETNNDGN